MLGIGVSAVIVSTGFAAVEFGAAGFCAGAGLCVGAGLGAGAAGGVTGAGLGTGSFGGKGMPLFVASLATGGAGGGGIGAVFAAACISCSGVAILPLFTALGLALSSPPKISAIFCCISASRASAAAS